MVSSIKFRPIVGVVFLNLQVLFSVSVMADSTPPLLPTIGMDLEKWDDAERISTALKVLEPDSRSYKKLAAKLDSLNAVRGGKNAK